MSRLHTVARTLAALLALALLAVFVLVLITFPLWLYYFDLVAFEWIVLATLTALLAAGL